MVHIHHNHGDISRRGRDDDLYSPTLQVGWIFSMIVKTPVGLTTNSAPASPHLMLVRSHFWKMVTTFENDKFFFLSLDSAVELAMGRVILEPVDHVVEINEEVIDLLARVEGSPGAQ